MQSLEPRDETFSLLHQIGAEPVFTGGQTLRSIVKRISDEPLLLVLNKSGRQSFLRKYPHNNLPPDVSYLSNGAVAMEGYTRDVRGLLRVSPYLTMRAGGRYAHLHVMDEKLTMPYGFEDRWDYSSGIDPGRTIPGKIFLVQPQYIYSARNVDSNLLPVNALESNERQFFNFWMGIHLLVNGLDPKDEYFVHNGKEIVVGSQLEVQAAQ